MLTYPAVVASSEGPLVIVTAIGSAPPELQSPEVTGSILSSWAVHKDPAGVPTCQAQSSDRCAGAGRSGGHCLDWKWAERVAKNQPRSTNCQVPTMDLTKTKRREIIIIGGIIQISSMDAGASSPLFLRAAGVRPWSVPRGRIPIRYLHTTPLTAARLIRLTAVQQDLANVGLSFEVGMRRGYFRKFVHLFCYRPDGSGCQ